LYSVVIAYAIVKHRLMDINIVIKKGAIYAYAYFLLLIPSPFSSFTCKRAVLAA